MTFSPFFNSESHAPCHDPLQPEQLHLLVAGVVVVVGGGGGGGGGVVV